MSNQTDRAWRGVPGEVPPGAASLALLELRAPGGIGWQEQLWLLREDGSDSLWAAVADCPERAVPVAAGASDGTIAEAGLRLLGIYLSQAGARLEAVRASSGILPADRLASLVARRGAARGWR